MCVLHLLVQLSTLVLSVYVKGEQTVDTLSFYILVICFSLVSVLFVSHDVPLCVRLLICCNT